MDYHLTQTICENAAFQLDKLFQSSQTRAASIICSIQLSISALIYSGSKINNYFVNNHRMFGTLSD